MTFPLSAGGQGRALPVTYVPGYFCRKWGIAEVAIRLSLWFFFPWPRWHNSVSQDQVKTK
jgi:hypothetical protein